MSNVISLLQKECLRSAWGFTVGKVKTLHDVTAVGKEWRKLANLFQRFEKRARDLEHLHLPRKTLKIRSKLQR